MKKIQFQGGGSYLRPSVERLRVSAEKGFAVSDTEVDADSDFDFNWSEEENEDYA